jgi:hypothetical protein
VIKSVHEEILSGRAGRLSVHFVVRLHHLCNIHQ